MIDKEIYFEYGDNDSEVVQLIHPKTFVKTASYSDELSEYIKTLKEKIDKTYALINALSSGEYYSSNRNGDYFPENALREYHKTFEAMGYVYKHHVNKDPLKSMGKVLFSHYNPKMHRVELIVEIDNEKGKDVLEKLDKGELAACSMGTRVPFDVCSICANKAKTRAEYCSHLQNQMNQVLPSGQKVYAINTMPKFFDISIVTIPADRTAGILAKILGSKSNEVQLFKTASVLDSLEKVAEKDNYAEITKNIQAKIEAVSSDPKKLIINSQARFSDDKLKKLASYPLNEVMSTLLGLRIFPCREDFQKLALYSAGKISLAKELEQDNIVFNIYHDTVPEVPVDVDLNLFNEKIATMLSEDISNMAMTKELILSRNLLKLGEFQPAPGQPEPDRSLISKVFFGSTSEPETTPHKNPLIPLGILGSLYYGFAKVFNNSNPDSFRGFMLKNKWLLPVLVGAGTAGSLFLQDQTFNKNASLSTNIDRMVRNSFVSIPLSYYVSGVAENKIKKGEPISSTENFVRKHPVITGLVASMGLAKVENILDKSMGIAKIGEFVNKLDDAHLNTLYNDLIGG